MLTTKNYKLKKPELTDSPPDITVMNFNWDIIDEKLFAVIQAWEKFKTSGGEIGGTDGTKLKIDGRTITAIGEALALIGEGTSPLYYARNRTHNVDQLIPGGKGELGSDEARWQEIYLGNYSKNANGYTKLPNGMILQWLYAGGSISQGKGVIEGNLPITFPNNYLSIFANVTYIDNDSTYNNLFNCNAKFVNKGYFNVNIKNLESNSGSFANCYVLAIGY